MTEYQVDINTWVTQVINTESKTHKIVKNVTDKFKYDASEIAQEVSLHLWYNRVKFEKNARSDSYMTKSIRNLAITKCQHKADGEWKGDNYSYSREFVKKNYVLLMDALGSMSILTGEALPVNLDFSAGWSTLSTAQQAALYKAAEGTPLTRLETMAKANAITKICRTMNGEAKVRGHNGPQLRTERSNEYVYH